MKWPDYQLCELAKRFISGGTPNTKIEEYWHGDIPWITGADFDDGEVILGRRYINQAAVDNSATNIVPQGSILIVTRTGVGKTAIAPVDIAISQDITGVIPKGKVLARYLIVAIRNKMTVILAAQRGATIKGVTRKDVENLPIPLPPPSEQRRIVEIIDQADRLRKLRADADAKAQRILPTLFLKMFGDPATNPKGWEQKTLAQTGSKVRYGLGQPPDVAIDGVPLIRATNIKHGYISKENMVYVNSNSVPSTRNAFLDADEVLVVRSGAYTGDVAQVTEEWKGSVVGYDLVITPSDKLRAEFIESYLLTPYIQKNYFVAHKSRAGQPHLNASQLENTPFYVPPKERQDKYRNMVSDLRKQNAERKNSEKRIQKMFQVILHRSFTGNLTASWRKAHMKELLQDLKRQSNCLETLK